MTRRVVRELPRSIIRALRFCRETLFVLLEPLDYLSRVINNKKDFPPLYLRRYVGDLRSFEASGAEFMAYLRLLCQIRPQESVLDIGCGCGMMALHLENYLDRNARYIGMDIHKRSIHWCRRNITRRNPQVAFLCADVKNQIYNPGGQSEAEHYCFPFEDQSFSLILVKSVFTHMRPPEVGNYLKEISRLLAPDGRCLATFFLLNDAQEQLAKEDHNKMRFAFGNERWRHVYKHSPESAVAYSEAYLMNLLQQHGLALAAPAFYGIWSGRTDGFAFQDMLLLHRQKLGRSNPHSL